MRCRDGTRRRVSPKIATLTEMIAFLNQVLQVRCSFVCDKREKTGSRCRQSSSKHVGNLQNLCLCQFQFLRRNTIEVKAKYPVGIRQTRFDASSLESSCHVVLYKQWAFPRWVCPPYRHSEQSLRPRYLVTVWYTWFD